MRRRLPWAIGSYAVLGALAGFTLDGKWRWVVWLFLAALAFKSWLAVKRGEQT